MKIFNKILKWIIERNNDWEVLSERPKRCHHPEYNCGYTVYIRKGGLSIKARGFEKCQCFADDLKKYKELGDKLGLKDAQPWD